MDCIFCKIVKGEAPSHKIWEDEKHLAFLSIFPNTEGFSVVITKEHFPSYPFSLPEDVLVGLLLATKKVAKLLDAKLDDVGRTGMILKDLAWIISTRSCFRCTALRCRNGSLSNRMSTNISKNTKGIYLLMTTKGGMMRSCLRLRRK